MQQGWAIITAGHACRALRPDGRSGVGERELEECYLDMIDSERRRGFAMKPFILLLKITAARAVSASKQDVTHADPGDRRKAQRWAACGRWSRGGRGAVRFGVIRRALAPGLDQNRAWPKPVPLVAVLVGAIAEARLRRFRQTNDGVLFGFQGLRPWCRCRFPVPTSSVVLVCRIASLVRHEHCCSGVAGDGGRLSSRVVRVRLPG